MTWIIVSIVLLVAFVISCWRVRELDSRIKEREISFVQLNRLVVELQAAELQRAAEQVSVVSSLRRTGRARFPFGTRSLTMDILSVEPPIQERVRVPGVEWPQTSTALLQPKPTFDLYQDQFEELA